MKQKPLQITSEGVMYCKMFTSGHLLKKEDITEIVLGEYGQIRFYAKNIGRYGSLLIHLAVLLGQFKLVSHIIIGQSLSRKKLLKITTSTDTVTFLMNDCVGFIRACKKIGIVLVKKKGLYHYNQ